jgi:molybdenum cofactor biosynthesis protein B
VLPGASAAVITASDTRGAGDDPSGDLLAAGLAAAGVEVRRRAWVRDEKAALEAALRSALAADVDVVLVTGGTGPAPRDVTPEAVRAVCERELPGFGELFRMLSFLEIGPAAGLSRALCALSGRQAVYALPGSSAACALALERLILPELDHLRAQLRGPAVHPPERNA